jgi:short-subunit dehydrogenase
MARTKKSIRGKRALITGAARGIGLAIAKRLQAEQVELVLADIDAVQLREAAELLKLSLPEKQARLIDVRDADAFADAVADIEHTVGPIDILINNAGIMSIGGFLEQELDSDHRQIGINLYGVIHGIRAVLPYMKQRDSGSIVNIASVAGIVGAPNAAVYSATKFGVVGLTQALHMELSETNIDFSYVCPSLVKTELIAGSTEPLWPKAVTAEEVADTVYKAITKRQVANFIPKAGRLSVLLPAILPRRVFEKIGAILGLNSVFFGINKQAREDYRSRIRSV